MTISEMAKRFYFLLFLLSVSCSPDLNEMADEMSQMLNSGDCVTVAFDGNHMGYQVSAEIHPDPETDEVGMARFFFTNGTEKIVIETPYYWDWTKEVSVSPRLPGDEVWATYSAPHRGNVVQGRESEIDIVQPFCFKDVDFDGEREILISTIGYNRIYYNAYKIISRTEAAYMTGMPQFVYGPDDAGTSFDYDGKRIRIVEYAGLGNARHEEYRRRFIVLDPLNPMRRARYRKEIIKKRTGI